MGGGLIDTIIAGHTHRPVFENLSLTERMYLEGRLGNMRKYGDRIPNSILRQAQDERRVGDSVATSEAGCGAYTLTIQREELEN